MKTTVLVARRIAARREPPSRSSLLGGTSLPASAHDDEGDWCEGYEVTKTVTDVVTEGGDPATTLGDDVDLLRPCRRRGHRFRRRGRRPALRQGRCRRPVRRRAECVDVGWHERRSAVPIDKLDRARRTGSRRSHVDGGNDSLDAGNGADVITGGKGNDLCVGRHRRRQGPGQRRRRQAGRRRRG